MNNKKVYIVGIGPGDPKYLTLEAYEIIKKAKIFIIPLKKGPKEELTKIREKVIEFCKQGDTNYRIIKVEFPERKKGGIYKLEVESWRKEKVSILAEVLKDVDEACFLVLGDPSLYDGHIEIFKEVSKNLPMEIEVIPGISTINLLSAKHKISLTKVAETLLITTPRPLRKQKEISRNTLVFLDNYETFKLFKDDSELMIYWGAYIGTEKEVLFNGKLSQCWQELVELRRKLKEKHGYIMETYLLTKKEKDE
jgi:precorrin-6A synthase